MTIYDIDRAMIDIVKERITECKARLDALPKNKVNARKAVQIELGMYTLCGNAGLMLSTAEKSDSARDSFFRLRQNVLCKILPKYPKLHKVYVGLDDEEQLRFVAALQSEIFMQDQIFPTLRAELDAASKARDAKAIFELTIKLNAVNCVLDAWKAWRVRNNIYPLMWEELS